MKTLNLIVLFAFFISCVYPCTDIEYSENENSNVQISATHHQNKAEEDGCSPLCVCTCCLAKHSLVITRFTMNDLTAISVNFYSYPFHILNLYSSIWQPPKIS